uniref:Uncharacterized protein n=1 Tax=Arundo donax TaxID=35708 RepID=A0A0A9FT93_ARUDO
MFGEITTMASWVLVTRKVDAVLCLSQHSVKNLLGRCMKLHAELGTLLCSPIRSPLIRI